MGNIFVQMNDTNLFLHVKKYSTRIRGKVKFDRDIQAFYFEQGKMRGFKGLRAVI